MTLAIGICVIFLIIKGTTSACNFPAGFQNTWTTSTRGTWVVGPSTISNVSVYTTITGPLLYTMDCYNEYNGFYVIRSQEIVKPFSTVETYVYMCLSLTELSAYKYTYAFGTTEQNVIGNVYERLIMRLISVSSVPGADVCNDTSYESFPDRTHVALLSGFETSGKQDCPKIMYGTFSYAGTSCPSTFVDICTDKGQLSMNTTQCSEKTIYSENGVLDCVYEQTIGSNTFVIVYNEDSSPDGSSYYQFSCLAVSRAGLLLYTSVNPEKCGIFQVSTKSPTNGYLTVYTDDTNSTCYTSSTTTSSTEDLTWLYVLIAVFGVLLVLGILVIIFCKLKREKAIQDEEVAVESESDIKSEKEDEKSVVEEKEEKSDKDEEEPSTSKKDEGDRTSVDSGVITDKDESRVNCDAVVVALDNGVEKEETLQGETHQEDTKSDIDVDEDQNKQSISDEEMETKHPDEGSVDGVLIKPETYQGDDENSESDADPEIKDREMEDDKSSTGVDTDEEEENKEDDGDKDEDDEDEARKSESRTDRSDSSTSFDEGYRDDNGKPTSGQNAIATLSKILITREMEERARGKRSRKKKGVKNLFAARKSNRGKVSFEVSKEADDHTDLEDMIRHNKTSEVPFIEQYNTKKEIERKLDEEHYWSDDEDKNKFNFQFDEFEEILEKEEGQQTGIYNTTAMEENALNQKIEELKDGSEDYVDISNELPVGYERNEDGRITRLSDGYVFTDDEFKGHFKPAKLKKIFNVPRLNRNKKGRPTGGLKEDNYGPEEDSLTDVKVGQDEIKRSESEEHMGRELQRMSAKSRVVGFDLKEEPDDFSSPVGKDSGSSSGKSVWVDTTAAIRETLRKRLFRKQNKKRKNIQEGDVAFNNGNVVVNGEADNGQPRELNNSIKVYGQHPLVPGVAPKSTLPPIGMQKDSESILMKHKQLQKHDVGLDNNNKTLNNFSALPPIAAKKQKVQQLQVKEAFPNVAMETLSDEELEKGESLDIGNEDEFFLVGPSQSENDKLFTRVRGPMYDDGQNQRRQRNTPWSLMKSRHKSNIGGQDVSRSMDDGPHSANIASRRQMDDKRLRELLEELYKDKKYFDHVIDTSDPQSGTVIDTRDLAEHGRNYLLDRAQFWDDRGPVPPRPPPTSLGLRISRMQTMHTNGSDSGRFSINSTITPPIIEPPNQIPLRQEQTTLPTIEPTNQIPLRQENTFS